MTEVISQRRIRTADAALRQRAAAVIPGGMYGHLSANALPAEYPQFYERSEGAHVWDVDGNEYVDLMCSFGPVILGHKHPKVEEAVAAQLAKGDTQAGPAACMVEAAELLVDRVAHADWAMFAKNGTDATTICLMVARAATGRSKVLAAAGAYHGSAPWCTIRLDGVTTEDRVNMAYYTYNDLASVERAAEEADGDVAAIIVSPFKHDAGFDQEMVDPAFARGLRQLCDRIGAVLVMDEVRAGFRLNDGGSWEPIGVEPDLSAWSKAIGNGYPLAAVLGTRQPQRGCLPDLRHRVVLVPGRPHGGRGRHDHGHPRRGCRSCDGTHRHQPESRDRAPGGGGRTHGVRRPDRCRCPTSGSSAMRTMRWPGHSAPQLWIMA